MPIFSPWSRVGYVGRKTRWKSDGASQKLSHPRRKMGRGKKRTGPLWGRVGSCWSPGPSSSAQRPEMPAGVNETGKETKAKEDWRVSRSIGELYVSKIGITWSTLDQRWQVSANQSTPQLKGQPAGGEEVGDRRTKEATSFLKRSLVMRQLLGITLSCPPPPPPKVVCDDSF